MRTKKVNRYWCDFCNKAGLPEPMVECLDFTKEMKEIFVKRSNSVEGTRHMDAITAKMIQKLIDVGTGTVKHLYRGQCPDPVAGQKTRDDGCSACKALDSAANQILPSLNARHAAGNRSG